MAAGSEHTVRTSDQNWLKELAVLYQGRKAGVLADDAGLGIDPGSQTLLEMARHARLSKREVMAAGVALGMSTVGIGMIVLAFLDPEPTSKLGLLVGGGALCVLTGGLSAVRIFTQHKPPNIRVTTRGIEISWS